MLVISIQLARAGPVTAGTATGPHRAAATHTEPIMMRIGAMEGFMRAGIAQKTTRSRAGLAILKPGAGSTCFARQGHHVASVPFIPTHVSFQSKQNQVRGRTLLIDSMLEKRNWRQQIESLNCPAQAQRGDRDAYGWL